MKIKKSILPNGDKIIVLTLSPAEVRVIALDTFNQPKVCYWFTADENDTEYDIRIDVDWSEGGTVQPNGD